ncbi:MAG: nitroreductase family protein [Terracidiphilus sp.]
MTLSAAEVHQLKVAPPVEGVLPVVLNRWSPRSFSAREVASADLHRVFEAAHWAASANNEQPWRYLIGRRGTETHSKIAGALLGFNQQWAGQAPVLILTLASARMSHNGSANAWALYDLGAANATLCLQAASLGLGTHSMAGYDQKAAREAFGISEEYVLGAVIALGYQGEPAELATEQLVAREIAPRSRKPLGELVFAAWGEPAELG